MTVERRTVGIVVLTVVLTVGLGGLGGAIGGFVGGVIGGLAGLLLPAAGVIIQRYRRQHAARKRLEAGNPALPSGQSSPTSYAILLRPEAEIVPFRARPELDALLKWCLERPPHIRVCLVTGEAGTGKTRLALELGKRLEQNEWRTFWVQPGVESTTVSDLREIGKQAVLVVDYSERHDQLLDLLSQVATDDDSPDMRVILLARSAEEWWQGLISSSPTFRVRDFLERALLVVLGPMTAAETQRAVFDDAVARFANAVGVPPPRGLVPLVEAEAVMVVQLCAALLAVLDTRDRDDGGRQQQPGGNVIEGLLSHEQAYWKGSAEARGLHLDVAVLRQAVAVACLAGADDVEQAAARLSGIPDLAGSPERRGQVARWLYDLYPESSQAGRLAIS